MIAQRTHPSDGLSPVGPGDLHLLLEFGEIHPVFANAIDAGVEFVGISPRRPPVQLGPRRIPGQGIGVLRAFAVLLQQVPLVLSPLPRLLVPKFELGLELLESRALTVGVGAEDPLCAVGHRTPVVFAETVTTGLHQTLRSDRQRVLIELRRQIHTDVLGAVGDNCGQPRSGGVFPVYDQFLGERTANRVGSDR